MKKEKGILKNKMQRKLLTIITVFALVVTSLIGQSNLTVASANSSSSQTNYVGPAKTMKDGAILHAWCWSFNTIKNNMKNIAEAGYTSVQTSPANACVVGNGGSKAINNWYYIYQPTDYSVGNYQLGTESEFKAMCDEADKYGVKIIVDVVANHVGNLEQASNNLKACGQWYHTTQSISNWNSRYDVTQLALMGMPDLNTQNKGVQNYIRNYLLRLLDLGADGFRFDAAKHIELPEDSGFGGDFWPTILNNSAEYQYGEILQDSCSNEAGYAKYMNVTASNYGMKLRSAIGANNFSTSNIMNYDINVSNDKLVTWVESHDNYANGLSDWGSSEWMNDEQIKLAWAALAARKATTPLFFSRPVGGGGQTWDNRFPGKSQLGDRGSDLFMDDEVAAVNNFRNAMVGKSEYLRNPNGDTKVLMVERGTEGVVIINLNYNEYSLSSVTNLQNGTYTNRTDNNNQFTVSNGRITGKLPARSVVVLYGSTPVVSPTPTPSSSSDPDAGSIYFTKPSNWNSTIYAYIYTENGSSVDKNAAWPGVQMSQEANGEYSCNIGINVTSDTRVIFSDGNQQSPGASQPGFILTKGGHYNVDGLSTTPSGNKVTIYYNTGWSTAYAHYKIGNGDWTSVPGVQMSNSSYSGYKVITIDLGTSTNLTACFNNGNGDWDSKNGSNYYFASAGTYTVSNGNISNSAPY